MRVLPMVMTIMVAVVRWLAAQRQFALQPVHHRLIRVSGGGDHHLDATLRQTVFQALAGTPGNQQRNAVQRVRCGLVCMSDFVKALLWSCTS